MKAGNEHLTDEAILIALEKLVLARSNPQLERYYAILLFKRASGEPFDISVITGLEDFVTDPVAQEFIRLAQLL